MNQQTGFSSGFGGVIVSPYPLPDALADMPTRVIPDDHHHLFALLPCQFQQGDDKHPHVFAVGLPVTKIEVHLLRILSSCSKAGQGFLHFTSFRLPLHQAQRFLWQSPGMSGWLGKAREPAFILIE